MLAKELARVLGVELLHPEMAEREMEIEGCYICDLLSNVMGQAKTGQLWLTVMTNINIVAVAQLLDLSGIVLLEGHLPAEDVLEKAAAEGIPVFSSQESAYDVAARFHQSGLAKP